MSASRRTAAVIMNLTLFPGTGQFLLGRKEIGFLFLGTAFMAMGGVILRMVNAVQAVIERGGASLPEDQLLKEVFFRTTEDQWFLIAAGVLMLVWLAAVVHASLTKVES